jgi:hypothetical protein
VAGQRLAAALIITYDALVADEGLLVVNDLSALWVPSDSSLTAGVRWSYVSARHPDEPDSAAAAAMQRVGPLVAWSFRNAEGEPIGNLSAFTLARWWLAHPYRTGEVSSPAVPGSGHRVGHGRLDDRADFLPW